MQSPTKNPVGASSVALGEWLMSPGNSNMGISPSRTTGHDIHFSPGMFSPTKSMGISLSAQGMGPVSSAFSPSMFSPASSRLLKKRHLYSPQGERALFMGQNGSAPSSSQHVNYQGLGGMGMQSVGYDALGRPVGLHPAEGLYGFRDRKRRAYPSDDIYELEDESADRHENSFLSQVEELGSGSSNRSNNRKSSKQSRRSPPNLFSPAVSGADRPPAKPSTVSPADAGHPMRCNCKKSKCLKLYCECFAALRYCEGCNCQDCNNNESHEVKRQDAIKTTRDRNTSAFQVKVVGLAGHMTGCNCKNSMCLKKYCECFQGGAFCANNCKCTACQNYDGSSALESLKFSGEKKRKGSPNSVTAVSESDMPSPSSFSKSNISPSDLALLCSSAPRRPMPPPEPVVMTETRAGLRSSRRGSGDSDSVSSSVGLSFNVHAARGFPSASESTNTFRSIKNSVGSPGAGAGSTSSGTRKGKGKGSGSVQRKSVSFMESAQQPEPEEVTYAFFGPTRAEMPKIVALQILDCLDGPSLYAMSTVNSIWAAAARDEALWEVA